jgi:hypothetical protein
MKIGIPQPVQDAIAKRFEDRSVKVRLVGDDRGVRIVVETQKTVERTTGNACSLDTLLFLKTTCGSDDVERIEFAGRYDPGEIGELNRGGDTPPTGYGVYTVWMKQ